jgi:DNA polymerase-3 subunit alpha
VVENLRLKRTKRGDKMAILTLEDPTGSIEVVVFPEVFNNYSHLLKGDEPVLISGMAEIDESAVKVISQEIETMESARRKVIQAVEIKIRAAAVSRKILEEIKEVVLGYPGESALLFRVDQGETEPVLIQSNAGYRVTACEELLKKIESITGEKVFFRYGTKNSNHRQL